VHHLLWPAPDAAKSIRSRRDRRFAFVGCPNRCWFLAIVRALHRCKRCNPPDPARIETSNGRPFALYRQRLLFAECAAFSFSCSIVRGSGSVARAR